MVNVLKKQCATAEFCKSNDVNFANTKILDVKIPIDTMVCVYGCTDLLAVIMIMLDSAF